MKAKKVRTGLRLRVYVAPDVLLGPGRADLLEGIRETGSIAAAIVSAAVPTTNAVPGADPGTAPATGESVFTVTVFG